jgi:hypothetical protein
VKKVASEEIAVCIASQTLLELLNQAEVDDR